MKKQEKKTGGSQLMKNILKLIKKQGKKPIISVLYIPL